MKISHYLFGIAALALSLAGGGAHAQETQVFKAWTVSCGQGADEGCSMRQQIRDQGGRDILVMALGKLPNNDNPGLLIVVPLGISLSQGVRLRVDDNDVINLPIERCVPQGCRIEGFVEPALLQWMKSGNKALIGFVAYDDQDRPREVQVEISLQGFTAAINRVMN